MLYVWSLLQCPETRVGYVDEVAIVQGLWEVWGGQSMQKEMLDVLREVKFVALVGFQTMEENARE